MTDSFAGPILFGVFLAWATAQASIADTPQDVLNHYLRVQGTLAQDSMKNVSANGQALAQVARDDETMLLPTAIAQEADILAKTKNLAEARQAFKPLSESLIAYFKTNGVPPGIYYEVYCPIAKAGWLQASGAIRNPYLGLRSTTPTWGWGCAGEVKTIFGNPSPASKQRTPPRRIGGMRVYSALLTEQTDYSDGKTNSPYVHALFAPDDGALFGGSRAAGFTFAFNHFARGKLATNAKENAESRNLQAVAFNRLPDGGTGDRIWVGDEYRKPEGLRLVSWSW